MAEAVLDVFRMPPPRGASRAFAGHSTYSIKKNISSKKKNVGVNVEDNPLGILRMLRGLLPK